jgi:predicted MFS family arabinose efflux permease
MNRSQNETGQQPKWMAVYAVSLGVAGLITAEFLPVSILSPIAKELNITEGTAGQTMSVTAFIAMFSSLFIGIVTRKIDRRWVVLAFSLLQVISSLLVAFAPNFFVLMLGRIFLGIAVGGFWALSISIAMRLVPEKFVPKALSIVYSAVSIATVISGPLASFLDGLIGWRYVFILVAVMGGISFIWQMVSLPSMPPTTPSRLGSFVDLLKIKKVRTGLLANMFSFVGYAIFFTYLRPFLENVTHLSGNSISAVLLVYGVANLMGAIAAKYFLDRSILLTLTLSPIVMALSTLFMIFLGADFAFAVVFIAVFAFAFGSIQVGWPTWLTKAAGNESESAGSLLVAFTQIALTVGAGAGGLIYDNMGISVALGLGSVFLLLALLSAILTLKPLRSANEDLDINK